MKEVIENGTIGFPAADPFPKDDRPMPYFIIGDDAFPPLRTWLTKPFFRRNLLDAERIYNYRLSRGEGEGASSGECFRHFEQHIYMPSHHHATDTKSSGIHWLGLSLSS